MRVELDRLTVTYPGGIPGLHETTVAFDGQLIGILGHNGSGKSTLIKVLAGSLAPTSGTARVDGQEVERRRAGMSRSRVSYLPQELPTFPLAQTPAETIAHSLLLARATDPADRTQMAARILALAGLDAVKDRPAGTLSGGEKQKVRIAQALVHNPAALILDEPTTGLDVQERLAILRLLHALSARMPVVFSTHDCGDVAAIADTAVIVAGGRVVIAAAPEDLTRRVAGRVWEWTAPDLAAAGGNGLAVTRLHRAADGVRVRAVGGPPPPGAVAASPTLEDAYVFLTYARDAFT